MIIKSIIQYLSMPIGISFIAILTCLCFYILQSENKTLTKWTRIIYYGIFVYVICVFLIKVNYRIHNYQVWDFSAFYLWGKAAAQGYNFYLPENLQIVFSSLNFPISNSDDFITEIVNVGFLYPPPTILYFLPLGYMSYNTALIIWTLFISIFLIGSIYQVYIQFFRKYRLNGLILVTILFLTLKSVNDTISSSQTNFILLFSLLLMRKYANNKYAGIILAFAFLTKPYILIFGIFFLIIKNWKAIIYFFATTALLSMLSIMIIGKVTFLSYLANNSTQRMPKWVFSEPINQSLHAILLRANLITLDKPYVYLIISALILGIVLVLVKYLANRKQYDLIWALLLLAGLLIYPGTLSYYGVLLLFIIFQFFHIERPLGSSLYFIVPILGVFYYLNSVFVFASICFLLILVIFMSFGIISPDKYDAQINHRSKVLNS